MSGARQVSGKQPADVGDRHTLLLRKVRDRLRLTALDSAPPAVRTDERLHQCFVAARLRGRHGSAENLVVRGGEVPSVPFGSLRPAASPASTSAP